MPRKMIKQDERYHDTLLLLKKYRDVVWSLSVSVEHAKSDFRECFGENIDEFLESVYVAGADLSGTDIEERAKCIERSNKMLQLVDSAVATMRKNISMANCTIAIFAFPFYYSYAAVNRDVNVAKKTIDIFATVKLPSFHRVFG